MKRRLTYANVLSTLALFMAIGGGAYAASTLPANSVGTKQIRNGAVTLRKLSGFARQALKGNRGPRGFMGLRGQTGLMGPSGPAGTAVVVRARGSSSVAFPPKTNAAYPLSNATWTQAVGESDMIWGQVAVTPPSHCTTGQFVVTLQLGTTAVGTATFGPGSGVAVADFTVRGGAPPMVMEPGVATARSLTVAASNGCAGSGQNFTIKSVAANVAAIK